MKTENMPLSVHGTEFQLAIPTDSANAQHFRQVFERNGQYEAVMTAILARLLAASERPVFADIGAFIGYYSVYAAKLLQGRGAVFAVESNPDYADTVRASLALNNIEDVRVFQTALWDREETLWANGVTLQDGSARAKAAFPMPEHIPGQLLGSPSAEGEAVAVQAITMDRLCAQHDLSPTIAKMDVHGTEGKILRGMHDTLHGPLQFLMLELHKNAYLRKYAPDISRMQILDILEQAGFTNYYVAGHRYTWSDGLKVFQDSGRFTYQPLTRETRGLLLFDRHADVFVLSAKQALEPILGPSILDPGLE